MRCTAFLLAILLLSTLTMADGLATSICVLETPAFERLVQKYGETAKIPTDVLWTAAMHRDFLKDNCCDTRFEREREPYRLLAARHGKRGQAIYSISREVKDKPSYLLCVGMVRDNEPKQDREGDPFVVVLREGNFLKQ